MNRLLHCQKKHFLLMFFSIMANLDQFCYLSFKAKDNFMRIQLIVAGVLLFVFSPLFCMKNNSDIRRILTENDVKESKKEVESLLSDMRRLFETSDEHREKCSYKGIKFSSKKEREYYLDTKLGKIFTKVWKYCDSGAVDSHVAKLWQQALNRYMKKFTSLKHLEKLMPKNDIQKFDSNSENWNEKTRKEFEDYKKRYLFIYRLPIQKCAAVGVVFPKELFSTKNSKSRLIPGERLHCGDETCRCGYGGFHVRFTLNERMAQELSLKHIKPPHAGPLSDEQREILATKQDFWG